MKLYTSVWVECGGPDFTSCPHRGTAHPPVELTRSIDADGALEEHYVISEDSLYEKLREVNWVSVARGHFLCPACRTTLRIKADGRYR